MKKSISHLRRTAMFVQWHSHLVLPVLFKMPQSGIMCGSVIKRPLVFILGAYLSGILLAWKAISISSVAVIAVLALIALYFMMYLLDNRWITKKDLFLWCLPFLLLFGFLNMGERMKSPDLYNAFDQEVTCKLSGRIKMIVEKKQGTALYVTKNIVSLSEEKSYSSETIIIYTTVRQNYRVGNQITASGTLIKFLPASNPGQFNEQQYYQIEDIDFKLQADRIEITDSNYSRYHKALGSIKSRLIEVYSSVLNKKEAGTLIAMLLGEKYLLDDEIKQLYQTGGISHVLAISGLHVSLIGMCIFWLLKKFRLPQLPSTIITVFLIYSYGELTNFSVSTNRAVVMMTVLLFAPLVTKSYDMLSATAFSALIILLQNPFQLFSAGFLLSFGAVLGIGILLPCLKQLFPENKPFLSSFLVNISAMAVTTPMILCFFYQFPTYSILVNLLILPFVTILTLTSLLAGIVGIIWLPLGIFLVGASNYILKLYEAICRVNDKLPSSLITTGRPSGLLLFGSALLLISFVIISRRYQKKASLILLALSMAILFLPRSNVGLEIIMLDIGQGDAIYMESAKGTSYLIDGGSTDVSKAGRYRLLPFLKYRGVDRIDYAIITHSDEDHVSAISELIEEGQIKVGLLLLPEIKSKDDNYLALEELARRKRIRLGYINTGDRIEDGEIDLYCLHPSEDFTITSANSYSTVLSVSYGDFDLLLTGDLEETGEKLITDRLTRNYFQERYGIQPATDYDILKVAHHGSKYSSDLEFLSIVRPELSLISCGRENRYGHPHPELLKRLEEIGSATLINYKSGAITIKTDGRRVVVEEYLRK